MHSILFSDSRIKCLTVQAPFHIYLAEWFHQLQFILITQPILCCKTWNKCLFCSQDYFVLTKNHAHVCVHCVHAWVCVCVCVCASVCSRRDRHRGWKFMKYSQILKGLWMRTRTWQWSSYYSTHCSDLIIFSYNNWTFPNLLVFWHCTFLCKQ